MPVDTPPNPPPGLVDLTTTDPLAGLRRWVADGRVDAAARERAKQRWLELQAGEEATVAGVLFDLADRGRPVGLTTRAGRRIRGMIVAMGADFAIVREERGGDVVVPFSSLAIVRAAPGDPPAPGDRLTGLEMVVGEALAELATERPRVLVAMGGEEVRGELRSVGFDVVAITLDGTSRETVHIPTAALDHVVVLP